MTDISPMLFSFSLFSILGWVLEVSYRSIRAKRFVNPGLLRGPYLPLYGTAALILMLLAYMLEPSHVLTKALAYCIATTGLELGVGLIGECLSRPRLWDYSNQRFNYRGHICLKFSLYWIFLAFAFEYIILPPYHDMLTRLSPAFTGLFSGGVLSIMLLDFLVLEIRHFLRPAAEQDILLQAQFMSMAQPLLDLPEVAMLSQYEHHRGKTRLEHVKEVAYLSFLWGRRLSLENDAIVRGALLHDLFYYDWRHEGPRLHGFRHHNIALKNARTISLLTGKEEDIIKKHMWPLTVVPPRYMESLVVSLVDTFCTVRDYSCVKKRRRPAKVAAVSVDAGPGGKQR